MLYKKGLYLLGVGMGLLLIGCGGSDSNSNSNQSSTQPNTTTTLPTSFKADEGRLLAANCAQCHGTNGVSTNGWDSIAGEKDLLEEFYEDEYPLMSAVAHGFSQDEVAKMGGWLSTLSKSSEDDNDD